MIDKLFDTLFIGKAQKVLFVGVVILFIASLVNRDIQSDENWLGEQSWWLLKEGSVKLKSIPFILNWDQEFLVYHKLMIWFGTAIIATVGWSVYYFKFFALLFFVISIYLVNKILRNEESGLKWLAILLLISVPIMFLRSFEFRPEVFVMTFGLASYYCLSRFYEIKSWKYIVIGAIFAACAFLSHLNGVIFCLSGFSLLLITRQYKAVFIFSLVAVPISFIYFIPLLIDNQLFLWVENLKNWPSHSFDDQVAGGPLGFVKNFFLKIINEHKRFFWGPEVIGISSLFVAAILIKGKYLWNNHKELILYTLLNILFMASVGSHKASRYLVFYLPLMIVVIVYAIKSLQTNYRPLLKSLMMILFVLEIFFYSFQAFNTISERKNYPEINRNIAGNLEKNSTVIAPWTFIYNEIENFNIYSYKPFEYLEENDTTHFSQQEFYEIADRLKVDYIIIDEKMKSSSVLHWFNDWEIESNKYYYEFSENETHKILKHK